MLINIDAKFVELTQNKRKILSELISMFKLINIQIIISRKVINNVSNNFYKESLKSMKFLIKKASNKRLINEKFLCQRICIVLLSA